MSHNLTVVWVMCFVAGAQPENDEEQRNEQYKPHRKPAKKHAFRRRAFHGSDAKNEPKESQHPHRGILTFDVHFAARRLTRVGAFLRQRGAHSYELRHSGLFTRTLRVR